MNRPTFVIKDAHTARFMRTLLLLGVNKWLGYPPKDALPYIDNYLSSDNKYEAIYI